MCPFYVIEIFTAVNIQRSISLFYPEDGNSKYLRKTYYHVENLVLHVCQSTLLPRHCYINLLLFLAKRRLSKT